MAYKGKRVPTEDGIYSMSFGLDQEDEIREFFTEYGVVVIRDVLTTEECNATINDMVELLENNSGFRYNDPETWHHWPATGIESYGQVQRDPYFTPAFLNNRQNENVLQAFAILYERPIEDLIIGHDRGCFFRPTGNIVYPNGTEKSANEFQTKTNLHLDLDPWGFSNPNSISKVKNTLSGLQYGRKLNHFIFENNQVHSGMYNGLHLQAGINLIDNKEADGGFLCVPGFANSFDNWTKENRSSIFVQPAAEKNSVQFQEKYWLVKHAQRITMKAGSIVIWDQRTPHGSARNKSSNIRAAQFLKVFPNDILKESPQRARARANTLRRIVNQTPNFNLSQTGRVVFGLNVV